ncbi:hypothetical protein H4217_009199 [Coemansia sp. RSA 1939]|nr:hypothetical protein H4217_009199 [Coemansia sp. RSA 1939]KAJ2588191.1 hypothetical protein EV177_009457 [Coemansia sp. RSA 1804]
MNVTINVDDNPGPEELSERVALLFNQVFSPEPAVVGSQVTTSRMDNPMTNYVCMVTIHPASTPVLTTRAPSASLAATKEHRQKRNADCPAIIQLPHKYLLRVYGNGADEFLSRENELYWLSQLTLLGFGAQIYCLFGNGRIEEYIESTTMTDKDIRDPTTSKDIAQSLCQLHYLVGNNCLLEEDCSGKVYDKSAIDSDKKPWLWAAFDLWMQLVKSKLSAIQRACKHNAQCVEILNNWSKVEQAALKYRARVEKTHSPVVFTHNDLQSTNILCRDDTGKLVIIDYEYAGYNYRGYDIANHFLMCSSEYKPVENARVLNLELYPSKEQRRDFLCAYIQTKALIDANLNDDNSTIGDMIAKPELLHSSELRSLNLSKEQIERDITALDQEIALYAPAPFLIWGMWGLLQTCSSDLEIDFAGYVVPRLSQFLKLVADME